MLRLDLAQLFLGAQVDRTKPVAVATQLFEIFLDLGQRRQFRAGLDFGKACDRLRLGLQHVVDFALDIDQTALGAVHAFFGAGAGLAGARKRLKRDLGGAVGLGHDVLGGSQRVRSDAAGGLGRLDFVDQRAALFRKDRRRIFKFGALDLDLVDTGFDRFHLRGGAGLAALPIVAFGGDRLKPSVGEFGFTRQRLRLGAHLGCYAAAAIDAGFDFRQPCFGGRAWRQFGKCRVRALMGAVRLVCGRRQGGCGLRSARTCGRRDG